MWHVAKCWKNDKSGEDTCHRIRDGNSQSVPAITVKSKIWDQGIEELAFFQFKSWNGSSLTKVSEVHGQKHIVNVSCCLVHSLIWLFELSGQMVWLWVLQNVVVVGVVTGHRHQRTKANADGVKDLSCGINPDLKYSQKPHVTHFKTKILNFCIIRILYRPPHSGVCSILEWWRSVCHQWLLVAERYWSAEPEESNTGTKQWNTPPVTHTHTHLQYL